MDAKANRKKILEELTRKNILESVIAILKKDGLKKITMDRVAEDAGIAKGTLYLYFKNKRELLSSAVDELFSSLDSRISAIHKSDLDPLEKLKQCFLAGLDDAETNRTLYYEIRTLIYDVADQELLNNSRDASYCQTMSIFSDILEEGVKKGILREMESQRVATLLLDSMYRLMLRRIFSATDCSIEKDVELIMDVYLHGLSVKGN